MGGAARAATECTAEDTPEAMEATAAAQRAVDVADTAITRPSSMAADAAAEADEEIAAAAPVSSYLVHSTSPKHLPFLYIFCHGS